MGKNYYDFDDFFRKLTRLTQRKNCKFQKFFPTHFCQTPVLGVLKCKIRSMIIPWKTDHCNTKAQKLILIAHYSEKKQRAPHYAQNSRHALEIFILKSGHRKIRIARVVRYMYTRVDKIEMFIFLQLYFYLHFLLMQRARCSLCRSILHDWALILLY